jgi:hypothetical protein
MLGGSVAKIDKILRKYKDAEIDYWIDWADARGKFVEADVLSKEAKSDPVQRAKYDEQKERIKKLETQVESKRTNVLDALVRQATGIIKDSERLKDYWEMKKAKIDEEVARESFDEVKKSSNDETIHDLFDTEIQRAAKIAKAKDEAFRETYGPLSGGSFFDQSAPDDEDDLTVSGIRIKDLVSKPISELQSKLKSISADKLEDILKYLERELKKIKDQRDDDIRHIKSKTTEKSEARNKDMDDLNKKVKPVIDVFQAKIDYIDQLLLSTKGLKQEIKNNPEIVTPNTNKELGAEGTDKAVTAAITQTSQITKKPDVEAVTQLITDQVKKNFESAKGTIEEAVGEKIEDGSYTHLKNDLIALYGMLVIYYNKLKKGVASKTMEFGLIDFATELYKYKKENSLLNKDLSQKDLDKQFDKYSK